MLGLFVFCISIMSLAHASGEIPATKEKRTHAHLRKLSLDDSIDMSSLVDEAIRKKMEAKRAPLAPKLPTVEEASRDDGKK